MRFKSDGKDCVLGGGIEELKFVGTIESFLDRLVVPQILHIFSKFRGKNRHSFQLFDGIGLVLHWFDKRVKAVSQSDTACATFSEKQSKVIFRLFMPYKMARIERAKEFSKTRYRAHGKTKHCTRQKTHLVLLVQLELEILACLK